MAFCANCGSSLPQGARFCPSCAHPITEDRPSEERKLATVLFADLVGSTELADSQDAERTRVVLNRRLEGAQRREPAAEAGFAGQSAGGQGSERRPA